MNFKKSDEVYQFNLFLLVNNSFDIQKFLLYSCQLYNLNYVEPSIQAKSMINNPLMRTKWYLDTNLGISLSADDGVSAA